MIGALSGSWMISGIVPTLIYYGMQIIHPSFFLASCCVICAVVSVMTGSSWTTIATIGIALMGIGEAQGFATGWVAGAIISGAYFGDKISPLSDTTVLASSVTHTPLFSHIRYMMLTTIPSMVITLIIFTIAGFTHTSNASGQIAEFAASLNESFNISLWLLIVPVVTGILIAKKVPSLITLFISTAMAGVLAIFFQPHLLQEVAGASVADASSLFKGLFMTFYGSTQIDTGNGGLEQLGRHPGYGGYDEYDLADHLRHVLRWFHDGQRYAGKPYVRIPALYETEGRHGGVYRILWFILEYRYGRSIHIYYPYRKYVQGYLQEKRI